MRIVQEIRADQVLKISVFQFPTQGIVHREFVKVQKRLRVVIQPAVHHLQTEHQPFRELPEIRLAEAELRAVDGGQECFAVDALRGLLR